MDYKKFQEFERRALATVYQEEPGGFHDDLIPQLAQRFLPEFGLHPATRILDIGSGPGVFCRAARDMGYTNITAVTLSPEDAGACRAQGFAVIEASMTDLPLPDQSVDFIWCRHALEHSPYPLFTLWEWHRVLVPGGQAWVEVPAPDNERAYIHEFNPNHYSILGERMWQALIERAGFAMRAFWRYDIDLPFDAGPYAGRVVRECSLMFGINKKTTPV